jgi:hypothetical protein
MIHSLLVKYFTIFRLVNFLLSFLVEKIYFLTFSAPFVRRVSENSGVCLGQ